MPLTDTTIKNAKPKAKPYRLFDGGGLYLEVAPAGGRWWRLNTPRREPACKNMEEVRNI